MRRWTLVEQNWWFLLTGAIIIGAMTLYNVYQLLKNRLPGRKPDANQVSAGLSAFHISSCLAAADTLCTILPHSRVHSRVQSRLASPVSARITVCLRGGHCCRLQERCGLACTDAACGCRRS